MADLIRCWRGSGGDTEPVACECEVFGHPNTTTTGEPMYANSHFLDIEDARESIWRNARARLEIRTHALAEARRNTAKAEAGVVEAGMHMAAVLRARGEDRG